MYFWACECNCIDVKVNLHMCKYTHAQTRCKFAFTYMYFWSCECAANIHMYANVSFLLFQVKFAVRIKYFCVKSKKYFNHSHFKTNTALIIKFHAHYVFTKILIFSYNNAQIHPNVTIYHAILKKVLLLSRKHEKRAVILRLPTKISPLLKADLSSFIPPPYLF